MTIADRISELRLANELSQEELAEKTGVSRQAVSKWETEQSIPDMYNIINLSEVFNVTTDYLLKGIQPDDKRFTRSALPLTCYNIVATILDLIGLVLSCGLYAGTGEPMMTLIGFVLITLGIMTFMIGTTHVKQRDQIANAIGFARINLWIVAFFVFSIMYNALLSYNLAPYPLFYGVKTLYNGNMYFNGRPVTDEQYKILTGAAPACFVVIYTVFCALSTYICSVMKRKERTSAPGASEQQKPKNS